MEDNQTGLHFKLAVASVALFFYLDGMKGAQADALWFKVSVAVLGFSIGFYALLILRSFFPRAPINDTIENVFIKLGFVPFLGLFVALGLTAFGISKIGSFLFLIGGVVFCLLFLCFKLIRKGSLNLNKSNNIVQKRDVESISGLVALAMNPSEGAYCRRSLDLHFQLLEKGVPSTRMYYKYLVEGEIVGVYGLHHYEWGPKENIWLGWFALVPKYQGQGHGKRMLEMVIADAKKAGHSKLFIETYNSPEFKKACGFYEKMGFRKVGEIDSYMGDNSMIVYLLRL